MFLTNNDTTICNLMIYSKGKFSYRVISKYSENIEDFENTKGYWVYHFQQNFWKFLAHRTPNYKIDFTMYPHGNMQKSIRLKSDNNGKLIVYDWGKNICF